MISLALPVSLANIMIPVVSSIDLFIVPARLEAAGYTVEQATELFGYLTGMAVPLVNMATILTSSLSASLVPAISEAYTLGDHETIYRRTSTAMRIANLITIPSFAGLCLLATPISQMLYGTPNAGTSIAVMALGIFLLGVHQVTTGVLQGLGHTAIPVANMVISAVVKTILSWVLTAMPAFGIMGAAWATNADFGVAAILNVYFVYRYVGFGIGAKDLLKIVAATAAMGGAVLVVYDLVMLKTLHNTIATLASIVIGGGVYAAVLLLIGGISANDIERLPRVGKFLAKIIRAFGLSRR
jgi:stage V sporulation protein B